MTNRQPAISIKQALKLAKPRYSLPVACVICGGELQDGRPAYCSTACAVNGQERHRRGSLRR